MVMFGQGYRSMSAPSKFLESLVMSRKLHHNNNPVLRWMASNVAIETDPAGNIKPTKNEKKSTGKIDGIVALVMALARATADNDDGESVYEDRGIITL
jgi:phage terminase large subunit-like protein